MSRDRLREAGPAVTGAGPGRGGARARWGWFAVGLLAGCAGAAAAGWIGWVPAAAPAVPMSPARYDKGATRVADVRTRRSGSAAAPAARWNGLRVAFLEAAAPVEEALDRFDRLRAELPAVEQWVREAEAGYLDARRDRELAESVCAKYAEVIGPAVQRWAELESATAETMFGRLQGKLDDVTRSRQRLADFWVAKGIERGKAERVATALFLKDSFIGQRQALLAQSAMDRATADRVLVSRYASPKQAKQLEADVFARRSEELAWQASWEKAKGERARLEAKLREPALSAGQSRLLHRLLQVIRESESPELGSGGPDAFPLFLDRFESGLAEAQEISVELRTAGVARRYSALIERLHLAELESDAQPGGSPPEVIESGR